MDTHRETDRDTVSFVAGAALVGIGMYVLEDEEPSTNQHKNQHKNQPHPGFPGLFPQVISLPATTLFPSASSAQYRGSKTGSFFSAG